MSTYYISLNSGYTAEINPLDNGLWTFFVFDPSDEEVAKGIAASSDLAEEGAHEASLDLMPPQPVGSIDF